MTNDPDLLDLLDAIASLDFERRVRRCGALIRYAIAEDLIARADEPMLVLTDRGAEVLA